MYIYYTRIRKAVKRDHHLLPNGLSLIPPPTTTECQNVMSNMLSDSSFGPKKDLDGTRGTNGTDSSPKRHKHSERSGTTHCLPFPSHNK